MANTIGEAYLQIRPSMEGVKSELEEAMGDAGERSSSSFGSAFEKGLKFIGGAALSAFTTSAGAVAKLTTEATNAYADYEQLVGGVETLFGAGGQSLEEYAEVAKVTAREIEDSGVDWEKYADTAWMENGGINGLLSEMQYNFERVGGDAKTFAEDMEEYLQWEYEIDLEDAQQAIQAFTESMSTEGIEAKYESMMAAQETVLQNAANAYETAGMSANDYMQTVIGMAGALNKATGDTEESARLADLAITDMADNVNKMGTSMEMVQNAYVGFSRGNFTMLDNLSLGFSGTKEGMQELLDQATAISGVKYDIESYADIVEAIHVVQEEMGIAGATADEAMGTISGSMGMLKASWQNLVAGIADPNADLGQLLNNVVTSGKYALDNLMPTIVNTLGGIASVLPEIANTIAIQLPTLVQQLLPPILDAVMALAQGIVAVLPDLLNMVLTTILSMLPMLIDLGIQLVMALADGLIQALPDLIPAVVDVILTIVDKLTDPDMLVQLVDAALQLIIALAEGLIKALPRLIAKAPEIIKNLLSALIQAAPLILEAGSELIFQLIEGVLSVIAQLVMIGSDLVNAVKDGFMEKVEAAKTWGKDMIDNFINGIKEKWEKLKSTVSDLANTVKEYLGFSEPEKGALSRFHTFAPDMMELFASGIKQNLGLVTDAMGAVTGTLATDFRTAQIAPTNYSALANPNEGLTALLGQNMAADGGNITIPVYIGQERLDTIIVNAQQRHALVSGGR